MGLRMPSYVVAPVLILLGLVSLYLFLFYAGDILPGSNWTTIRDNLLPFYPYLAVLVMALYSFLAVMGRQR